MRQNKLFVSIFTILAIFLTGNAGVCNSFPGERTAIDVDVIVLRASGAPAANDEVFIAEWIDGILTLTGSVRTDVKGHLQLKGYYCLPMAVAGTGAYIVIHPGNIEPTYTLRIRDPGKGLSVEEIFGKRSNMISENIEKIRLTCSS